MGKRFAHTCRLHVVARGRGPQHIHSCTCVRVCNDMRLHVCACGCMSLCERAYMHKQMRVHKRVDVCACACLRASGCLPARVSACVQPCAHVRVRTRLCDPTAPAPHSAQPERAAGCLEMCPWHAARGRIRRRPCPHCRWGTAAEGMQGAQAQGAGKCEARSVSGTEWSGADDGAGGAWDRQWQIGWGRHGGGGMPTRWDVGDVQQRQP